MAEKNQLVESIQKMIEDNVDERLILETLISQGIGETDAKVIFENARKDITIKVKRQVVSWIQDELKNSNSFLYSAFEKKLNDSIVLELKSFTQNLEKHNLKMQTEVYSRMNIMDKKVSLITNNQNMVRKRLEEVALMQPRFTGNVFIRLGLVIIGLSIIGFTLFTFFNFLSTISTEVPDLISLFVLIIISVVGMFILYVGTEMKF